MERHPAGAVPPLTGLWPPLMLFKKKTSYWSHANNTSSQARAPTSLVAGCGHLTNFEPRNESRNAVCDFWAI